MNMELSQCQFPIGAGARLGHHPGCACPFKISRISKMGSRGVQVRALLRCVVVGQGPAFAKACLTHAIAFGTKEKMTWHGRRLDQGS